VYFHAYSKHIAKFYIFDKDIQNKNHIQKNITRNWRGGERRGGEGSALLPHL